MWFCLTTSFPNLFDSPSCLLDVNALAVVQRKRCFNITRKSILTLLVGLLLELIMMKSK